MFKNSIAEGIDQIPGKQTLEPWTPWILGPSSPTKLEKNLKVKQKMHFIPAADAFSERFTTRIRTIDSHTAGEITRLVIGMQADIPGDSMRDKRMFFIENFDGIRKLLTHEPRESGEGLAAVVTEPVTRGAEFGLIYMDAHRYPYLCGHATIGAVTTLIEAGILTAAEGEDTVVVDTPSGPMAARAVVKKGRVESVAIDMVPSFVYATDCPLNLSGLGELSVSLVCVGGFFAGRA